MKLLDFWFMHEPNVDKICQPALKYKKLCPSSLDYYKTKNKLTLKFFNYAEKIINDWKYRKRMKKINKNRNKLKDSDF